MKKVLLILAIVVLVLGGTGALLYAKLYGDDFNRFGIAFKEAIDNPKGMDMSVTAQFQIDIKDYEKHHSISEDDKMVYEVMNQYLVNTKFQARLIGIPDSKDVMSNKIQMTSSVYYKDELLTDLMAYIYEGELGLALPTVTEQSFTMSEEDLWEQADISGDKIDWNQYKENVKDQRKVYKDIELQKYIDILREYLAEQMEKGDRVKVELADGKSVSCREYSLSLSTKDFLEMSTDIADELSKDDEFREYVRLVALSLMNELLDSKDYKEFDLDKDAMEEAIDLLEDEDDFADDFDAFFEGLLDELEYQRDELEKNDKFEFIYAIDAFNNLRKLSFELKVQEVNCAVDIVMNNVKRDFDKPNFKDPISITELINDEEFRVETLNDIGDEQAEKFAQNKAIQLMFEDLSEYIKDFSESNREIIEAEMELYEEDKEAYLKNFYEQIILEDGFDGLIGHGTKEVMTVEEEAVTEEPTVTETITFFVDGQYMTESDLTEYVEAFEEENPNIDIEANWVESYVYSDQMQVQLAAGEMMDVVCIPNTMDMSDYNMYFEPLGSLADLSEEYLFLDNASYNGNVYGIPLNITFEGMLYNKGVFEAAGITELPADPESFIADMKLIQDQTDALPLYTCYTDMWPLGYWESQVDNILGASNQSYSILEDDAPWTKGAPHYILDRLLYDLVAEGLIDADLTSSYFDDGLNKLAMGEIGVLPLGSWALQLVQDLATDPNDIAFLPFPYTNEDGYQYVVGNGYGFLGISQMSEHKDAAKKWIEWLINESDYYEVKGVMSPIKYQELPLAYNAFINTSIALISDKRYTQEEEGLLSSLYTQTDIDLWYDYRKRIVDGAQDGLSFDEIAEELNQSWIDGKNALGIQ